MNSTAVWFASRATGAVSMVLFTIVMLLGIATKGRAASPLLPRSALLRLHRATSLTALAFLAIHIASAIADGYVKLDPTDVFVPFRAGFDPFWTGLGAVAVDLLLAVTATSALRGLLTPRSWRMVHRSAYAMWLLALTHGWGVAGGDGHRLWMKMLDLICLAAVSGAAVFWRRRARSHPDPTARRAGLRRHPVEPAGASR